MQYLVNSHLHFDHAGGNVAVPNATIVVQRREWQAAHDEAGIVANNYTPADFDTGQPRLEVDGEHDLFGDGRVICLPTFGHTPGHQSLLVRLDGGDVVLAADACYFRQTLEELRLPLVVHDPVAMLASLQRLRALAAVGTRIVYGHDPESWATMPQAPGRDHLTPRDGRPARLGVAAGARRRRDARGQPAEHPAPALHAIGSASSSTTARATTRSPGRARSPPPTRAS